MTEHILSLASLKKPDAIRMDRAEALCVLGLDARKLDGLLRLCDPQRYAGSPLASKATAYLQRLRDGWTACDHPSGWLDKHPPYEPPPPAKQIELPDDPLDDLWAAG